MPYKPGAQPRDRAWRREVPLDRGYALGEIEKRQPRARLPGNRKGCEPRAPRRCDCWACRFEQPPSVDPSAKQYRRPGE
jgi:hypothetical protein